MRRNPAFTTGVGAIAVATLFSLAACSGDSGGGTASDGGDKDPYVIGYNDDLSGPISFAGLTNLAGVETYIDYINDQGGVNGHQIDLVKLDSRADGATSVSNYKQLVEDEGALVVLGNSASSAYAATGPLGEQYEVPMIGFGNADDFFTTYYPWLFKNGLVGTQQAELLAQTVEQVRDDVDGLKVGILASDTASGPVHIDAVNEIAKEHGWEVVETQLVAIGATDCTAQAAKLAASGADIIMSNVTSVGEDIICFQQLEQRGFAGQVFNTVSSATENTYATLKSPNWIGLRNFSWWEDDSVPGIVDMASRAEQFGTASQLGAYSTDGYIAAILAVTALNACGDDCTGTAVRDALEGLTDVDTGDIAGPGLGFTTGDLGHTTPQSRAYRWDDAEGKSVPVTDWLTVPGR
ncbi:ABC transporter substrate-binding protein [Microbacterium sp. KHB019]|jgi:branched-chain amino acid transport system substrate-binding protein|uniref:ABC transporter substrate-binding protein n=1 Tax=Microbacterium sp. KHB019 TaxID=3129770 RepID=UPI00307A87A3